MFQLIKIQLEIFAPLQTLFSPVNYFLLKISANVAPTLAPEKKFVPLQTLFPSLKIAIF